MTLNPFKLYDKAVRAVPSIKYALGVAGVVAAGAMAVAVSKDDPKLAVLSFVAVILGMCLLLAFAAVANALGRWPGIVLVWSVTIVFVCMLIMTLSALAIGKPANWARLIGVREDNPPAAQVEGLSAASASSASASSSGNCAPAMANVSVGGSMNTSLDCSSAASTSASAPANTSSPSASEANP